MKPLSDHEKVMLEDLSFGPIGPEPLHTGRLHVDTLEGLVERSFASAHRSSIGEITEKATYSITDAGKAALVEIHAEADDS